MKVNVHDSKGAVVDAIELPADIFEAPINIDLMHQAYVRQMAGARAGTHETKTRSEVRGGGKKPWKQKGTGNARQGSRRAAQWVGGGKIHTPHLRDYSVDMPRKMRRAALRSALSVKAAESQIIVVDTLDLAAPKTKDVIAILQALGVSESKTLVLLGKENRNVGQSLLNLARVRGLNANYLNIRDLLGYEKLILPLNTLAMIKSYLSVEA
jgi:large subunit ribosomal protein L4